MLCPIEYKGHTFAAEQPLGTLAPSHALPEGFPGADLVCGCEYSLVASKDGGKRTVWLYLGWSDVLHVHSFVSIGDDGHVRRGYTVDPSALYGLERTGAGIAAEARIPVNADVLDPRAIERRLEEEGLYNVLTREHAYICDIADDYELAEEGSAPTAGLVDWKHVFDEAEKPSFWEGVLQLPRIGTVSDLSVEKDELIRRIRTEPGWGAPSETRVRAAEAALSCMETDGAPARFLDEAGVEWRCAIRAHDSGVWEVWVKAACDDVFVAFSGLTDSYTSAEAAKDGLAVLAAAVAAGDHGGLALRAIERRCEEKVFGEDLFPGGASEWTSEMLAHQQASRAEAER